MGEILKLAREIVSGSLQFQSDPSLPLVQYDSGFHSLLMQEMQFFVHRQLQTIRFHPKEQGQVVQVCIALNNLLGLLKVLGMQSTETERTITYRSPIILEISDYLRIRFPDPLKIRES